ncbi:MAG: hypothetical protein AAB288_07940, partial [Acidobacteriota bacterium]
MPGRKMKCPQCKQPILVRTDPAMGEKVLLREDQLAEHEAKSGDIYAAREWRRTLQTSDGEWEGATAELRARFGSEPKQSDVVWQCMNGRIAKTRDLHELKLLYFQMAR